MKNFRNRALFSTTTKKKRQNGSKSLSAVLLSANDLSFKCLLPGLNYTTRSVEFVERKKGVTSTLDLAIYIYIYFLLKVIYRQEIKRVE